MPIKLTEGVVHTLIGSIFDYLTTEIDAVNADRGDGITVLAPYIIGNLAPGGTVEYTGDIYNHPKAVISGEKTTGGTGSFVEVYEGGPVVFTNASTDHQGQRATFIAPVTIRVTWLNRSGDTEDTMYKRARRYASAVVSVFAKHPSSGTVRLIRPTTVNIGDGTALKGSVSVGIAAECEEAA